MPTPTFFNDQTELVANGRQSQIIETANGGFALIYRVLTSDSTTDTYDLHIRFYDANSQQLSDTVISEVLSSFPGAAENYRNATTLANGSLVVAWLNHESLLAANTMYVTRFDQNGVRIGEDIEVGFGPDLGENAAFDGFVDTVALNNGGFIVCWSVYGYSDETNVEYGRVFARFYDADGDPSGAAIELAALGANPHIVQLANGNLVLGYTRNDHNQLGNDDIKLQLLDSSGTPIPGVPDVTIDTAKFGAAFGEMRAYGDGFVMVWADHRFSPDERDVWMQFYDEDLATIGPRIAIDGSAAWEHFYPTVVTLDDGSLFVVYEANGANTFTNVIWGQRYNSDGSLDGSRVQISGDSNFNANSLTASALADGRIILSWDHHGAAQYRILEPRETGITLAGDDANETWIGTSFSDTFAAAGGADRLIGANGNDVLNGGAGDDVLDGGSGADIASYDGATSSVTVSLTTQGVAQNTGGGGSDTLIDIEGLTGSAHNDTLTGTDGANVLNGGAGADVMSGGAGADTYVVDDAGDVVNELAGGGADTVQSAINYTLGSTVENLTLTGSANINGVGNDLSNFIVGNGGDNVIDGGSGADTIDAQAGDDTVSGGGGADVITGGDGNDVLYGHSAGASSAITSTVFASGFSQPVAGAAAPGDAGYLYITERASGIIWRTDIDTGARTQFVQIPDNVFDSDGEGGALGLAFHPNYAANGRFFVFLTDTNGDLQVREFARAGGGGNPPTANTTSTLVIEVGHPGQSNHNAGWIEFSPTDGHLYIATGDGGGGGDPNNNAQNLNSLLGKILRIDVNGADAFPADPNKNFAIPATNPFVGVAGADEIWHFGLRNPFRNAFDPRNGDLYIGDVGQSAREEVDYAANGVGGLNFGWRIMEGTLPYPPGSPDPGNPNLIDPIFEYDRGIGTTITGGEVYVGSNAGFVGQYVFADYGSDRIFTLRVENGVAYDALDRTNQFVGPRPTDVVDFVSDAEGNLYAVGLGGTIWRITPAVGAEDVDDALFGGAGNDTLDGNFGADQMYGGDGNDTYYVDNAGDVTFEAQQAWGVDTVISTVTYTLGQNIDNLTLGGSAALNGTGNALNNVLLGNGAVNALFGQVGNDTLNGMAGADQMYGGEGDDIYIVDNTSDVTFEAQQAWGLDLVQASATYTLGTNIDNLTLTGSAAVTGTGNALNNVITGNGAANGLFGQAGNDTLNGMAGADQMYGGEGNDTYVVDNTADVTYEAQSAWGVDLVQASADYTLGANIDNLQMMGAANLIGYGNALANTMTGNAGANTLFGYNGNDTLDGALGADQMYGGDGNDTYYVDNVADVVYEASPTWGTDLVYTSVNFTLGSNVDHLTLTGTASINGTGNLLGNIIHGNSGANSLFGLGGNDTLEGGADADQMYGGEGDDTYLVDNSADVTFEAQAGWGTDVVQSSASYALGQNIDNLILLGSANLSGTGNALANALHGNSGANVLNGRGGNDQLSGNGGDDDFVFIVGSGDDTVTDFVAGGTEDAVDLSAYNGSGVTWNITQVGANTVFDFTNGDQITLLNVTMGNLLHTSTFIYD